MTFSMIIAWAAAITGGGTVIGELGECFGYSHEAAPKIAAAIAKPATKL